MYLTFSHLGQVSYKIKPKIQGFKRVLGLELLVKGGLNHSIFFNWLQNLVLSYDYKNVQKVIQIALK